MLSASIFQNLTIPYRCVIPINLLYNLSACGNSWTPVFASTDELFRGEWHSFGRVRMRRVLGRTSRGISLTAQGAISRRLRIIEVYAGARGYFLSLRGTTFCIWKISLGARPQRDSRSALWKYEWRRNYCGCTLLRRGRREGPRNGEAFNEIICAPSAVRTDRAEILLRPGVFNACLSLYLFSSRARLLDLRSNSQRN